MRMRNLKIAFIQDLVRLISLLLCSLVLAIIVNTMHPMGLPLLLTEVKRPGIPIWVWNQLRFTNARDAYDKVLTGHGILIDVRDRDDYRKSHAIGAINFPYHEFENAYPDFAKEVPTHQHVFIYCYGTQCGLSARVAKRLLVLGFENLTIIKQGFEAWGKSNLPVKKMQKGDKHETEQ